MYLPVNQHSPPVSRKEKCFGTAAGGKTRKIATEKQELMKCKEMLKEEGIDVQVIPPGKMIDVSKT